MPLSKVFPSIDLSQIACQIMGAPTHQAPIILLHDSLGCIALWRDFPALLAQATNRQVWVYDRQGHGQSCSFSYEERLLDYMENEADFLIELMDMWQLPQAHLFGHSDGGSIALIAAAKYPTRIASCLTEGAHIFVEKLTIEGIRNAMALYQNSDLPQKLEKYHGSKTQALFDAWTQTWLRKDFKAWNIESFLKKINCPVLVIQGEQDEYGTEAQVDGIVNQVGGLAEKWLIKEGKHSPHKEFPEQVLKRSSQFIKSADNQRMEKKLTFKIIAYGSAAWKEAVALREEILRKSLGIPFTQEELEAEKEHIQIAGYEKHKLVATCVLVPEFPKLKMQRVAVLSEKQNKGYGTAMLNFCEKIAHKAHMQEIYCHARDQAVNFYLKHGFKAQGNYFLEDGIAHLHLFKALNTAH